MMLTRESPGTVGAVPPEVPAMPPTFADLVRLEPRLALLRNAIGDAPAVEDPDSLWYGPGGFKRHLSALVGWFRTDPGPHVLFTPEAYQAAYAVLYALADSHALPIKVCSRGSANTR